jgi:hypothetical protein
VQPLAAESPKGILITIEDGYGETTPNYLKEIHHRLEHLGHKVRLLDLTDWRPKSSNLDPELISNPYKSFLLDVAELVKSNEQLMGLLEDGHIVLASSYFGTVVTRHADKFKSQPERAAFFLWCEQMVYDTFGLVRPALNLIIGGASDNSSYKSKFYEELAGIFSRDFKLLDCYRNGQRVSDKAIDKLLYEAIISVLPAVDDAKSQTTHGPSGETTTNTSKFDVATASSFATSMKRISELCGQIVDTLQSSKVSQTDVDQIRSLCQPVDMTLFKTADNKAQAVVKFMPSGYSQDFEEVKLISHWPRQEHDLLPELMFDTSELSTAELQKQLDKMKFEDKDQLLGILLKDKSFKAKVRAWYTFELLTSVYTLQQFKKLLPGVQIIHQQLSPRYGYDLPSVIDENDLVEQYQECFDISTELSMKLEAAGHSEVAHQACLMGHRLRWRTMMTLEDVLTLSNIESESSLGLAQICKSISQIVSEQHPVLIDLPRG